MPEILKEMEYKADIRFILSQISLDKCRYFYNYNLHSGTIVNLKCDWILLYFAPNHMWKDFVGIIKLDATACQW